MCYVCSYMHAHDMLGGCHSSERKVVGKTVVQTANFKLLGILVIPSFSAEGVTICYQKFNEFVGSMHVDVFQ